MAGERDARLRETRALMQAAGLDALLLTSPESIYYLAGLNHLGYFAPTFLLVSPAGPLQLVARAMERPTLEAQAAACEHVLYADGEDPAERLARAIEATQPSRVGVEQDAMYMPVKIWEAVSKLLPAVAWADCSTLVLAQRSVKSPLETELVRAAGSMSDRALLAGIARCEQGSSELEVARAIYDQLIAAGSDAPAFPPLVRTSENIPQEHVTWRPDRVLAAGDRVFLELGASAARYHAPMSRIVYVGHKPDGVDASARAVLAGFDAICGSLKPGATASEVYEAWQSAVSGEVGHANYHRHHCGYLTGLGFPPSWCGTAPIGLRRGSSLVIKEGMVCHVMSWLLGQETPDYGVSDTAVVTAGGCELVTSVLRAPAVI